MENDFENKMENLQTPKPDYVKHQEIFKIGLMNAKKSSRIGIIFILVPLVIILVVYIKYMFFIHIDYSTTFASFTSMIDKAGFFKWIIPLVFIGLPVTAIFINLMAISHFYINKPNKELIISIQYRLKNFVVLIVSILFLISFLIFVMIENVHFK
jgi:hypothetical protein